MTGLERLRTALQDRYRIERELGQGGMATVYLALDLKHHRQVAVKVLRPELAAALGPDRFLREIETTASLRHPHILPLFDSGHIVVPPLHGVERGSGGEVLFYVMPFAEGESLRDRLSREKQLPIEDALQIAREVADALSYAHGRHIVHRDIKPENILLESGHAVVADFGIARAISAAGGERLTETGLAVGTVQYMSPEQAAGDRDLDGRSDLYALGCVLYEMLAGEPPFTGPTVEAIVRQHLTAEPRSITQLRPAVPAEVAAALARALAKTPADRFNPVGQFAEALGKRGPAAPRAPEDIGPAAGLRRSVGRWVVGAAAVVTLLGIAMVFVARRGPNPLQLERRIQVTLDPGLELDPALSPDGRFLAYSGPQGTLLVRQVDGGSPIPVVRDGDGRGRWPSWAPDGRRIVFISPRGIEIVPALGGGARLLVADTTASGGVAVAPDGGSFAFASHDSVYAKPVDGGTARLVAVGWEVHSPAWSPDARWIAYVSGNAQYVQSSDLGNLAPSSIWVAPAAGGAPVRVTDEQFLNVSPAWTPGGSLIYVSTRDGGRDAYQLNLSGSGDRASPPSRLTTGLNAHGINLSLDGKRFTYSAFTETSNIWYIAIPGVGAVSVSEARPVTVGNQTIENLGVSPDGQWVAFSSDRSGVVQLYRMRLVAGAEPQQLTADSSGSFWADWSPDGREIAFHRFVGVRRQAFVMSAEGSSPVQVTKGLDDERSPDWSPDGERLLLIANWGTEPALHVVTRSTDGSWSLPRPFPITIGLDTIATRIAAWSPDGRFLACGCGSGGVVIAPVEGGSARRLASPFPTTGWTFPQWSADGRVVYHLSEEGGRVANVVAVPLSGGTPRVVVRFDDPTRPWHRFGFRVRGGRIYFTLGDLQSDIWVAEATQK